MKNENNNNDFKLEKYLGKWYEMASTLPSYQKNCRNTTAEYTDIGNNKYIEVLNSCDDQKKKKRISSKLRAYKTNKKSQFDVIPKGLSFLSIFFNKDNGNYNIRYIDKDYKNVIVTTENEDTVWFLSRNKKNINDKIKKLKEIAKNKGIDTSQLIKTIE